MHQDDTNPAGYIKLYRKMRSTALYRDGNAMRVFIDLLLRLSAKPWRGNLTIGGKRYPVSLEPGQVATRCRLMAQDLGMSDKTVRRKLRLLAQCRMIELENRGQYMLVTVLNWEKYNGAWCGSDAAPKSQPRPPGPHQDPPTAPTRTAHNKNKYNKKEPSPGEGRAPTYQEQREAARWGDDVPSLADELRKLNEQ